jgi:hypothetical protein
MFEPNSVKGDTIGICRLNPPVLNPASLLALMIQDIMIVRQRPEDDQPGDREVMAELANFDPSHMQESAWEEPHWALPVVDSEVDWCGQHRPK